jgi:hypothetical protein
VGITLFLLINKRFYKYWNLNGQVARENRSVFGFQNGQVVRDNGTNFRGVKTLAEVLLNFKMGRSPVKIDKGNSV